MGSISGNAYCLALCASFVSFVSAQTTDPCKPSPCDPLATCRATNSRNFTCSPCPTLYLGDGKFCVADYVKRVFCNNDPRSWKCDDGSCIPLAKLTDDVRDCTNGEDEHCDISSNRIRCGNRCVYVDEVETECQPRKHRLFCDYYNYVAFECHDGKSCVPCTWVKDGFCSCGDCSDESNEATTDASCDYYYYYY